MHYEVRFTGTENEMTNQAWQETLDYLGGMTTKLAQIKEEQQTEGNAERSEKTAQLIGMFWGIQGYYPNKALQEFFIGTRNI